VEKREKKPNFCMKASSQSRILSLIILRFSDQTLNTKLKNIEEGQESSKSSKKLKKPLQAQTAQKAKYLDESLWLFLADFYVDF
jgi:hypothetical protein